MGRACRLAMVVALAIMAASCGSTESSDYDATATADCLKNRPEYVPGPLPQTPVQEIKVTRLELQLYGPKVNRKGMEDGYIFVPAGVTKLGAYFIAPPGIKLDQSTPPFTGNYSAGASMLFFPSDAAARRAYEHADGTLDGVAPSENPNSTATPSAEQVYPHGRNVLGEWGIPESPADWRRIIVSCLKQG
jgi:hypothetical protein